MNEDYLWNKSGEDTEIEKLEIALKAFRYQETAAPEIPAKILPFKKERQRKLFRFAVAAAACLAFAFTILGIWTQLFYKKIEIKQDLAAVSQKQENPQISKSPVDETKNDFAVSKPISLPVEKAAFSKTTRNQKVIKTRQAVVPVKFSQMETAAQKIQPKKPDVKLTKEEQYAYDQLMLALSITSSKLKIVKDKVDGIEETNAVLER